MLKIRLRAVCVLVLAMAVGVAGCGDTAVTAPAAPESQEAPRLQASQQAVQPLPMVSWNQPRATSAQVTKKIGLLGGTISAGGVTLVVPPLAVRRTTSITLTVPAGQYVMADLEPHGLQFGLPPLLLFPLLGTDAGLLNGLVGVYTEGEPVNGMITPTELYPVGVVGSLLGFQIDHFSKYAPAKRGGLILVGG